MLCQIKTTIVLICWCWSFYLVLNFKLSTLLRNLLTSHCHRIELGTPPLAATLHLHTWPSSSHWLPPSGRTREQWAPPCFLEVSYLKAGFFSACVEKTQIKFEVVFSSAYSYMCTKKVTTRFSSHAYPIPIITNHLDLKEATIRRALKSISATKHFMFFISFFFLPNFIKISFCQFCWKSFLRRNLCKHQPTSKHGPLCRKHNISGEYGLLPNKYWRPCVGGAGLAWVHVKCLNDKCYILILWYN